MASLIVKAPSINEFYFSGSQTVLKGQEVAWILDDVYAFKTTEECSVSANRTPFINLAAGQVFVIKKSMPYVFDIDTVVGLAYPQENVQDLLIQNDIYNNNMSTINIEANAAPTVSAGANKIITIGSSVTIYSSAIAVSPATISSYSWVKNSTQVATTANYTFTPTVVGDTELTLIVTDSDGRKAYDSVLVTAQVKPVLPNVVWYDTSQLSANVFESTWTTIFQINASQTITNGACKLDYSAGFWVFREYMSNDNYVYSPSSFSIRLTVAGVVVYTGTVSASTNTSTQTQAYKVAAANFTRTINNGDAIKLEVYWSSSSTYAQVISACTNCIGVTTNGQMQLTINPN